MESLLPTWLQEIGRAGLGYLLFLASMFVLWRKDQEVSTCRKEAREDTRNMTGALEKARVAVDQATEVLRQNVETQRVSSAILERLTRQIEQEGVDARDRSRSIIEEMRQRRGG